MAAGEGSGATGNSATLGLVRILDGLGKGSDGGVLDIPGHRGWERGTGYLRLRHVAKFGIRRFFYPILTNLTEFY
jgi:hypothetical protein